MFWRKEQFFPEIYILLLNSEETIMRFNGIVNKVNGSGDFGFISRASVKAANGSKASPGATRKDIFVHTDDCTFPLAVGKELTFEVKADERRGGDALRAFKVREASKYPVMGGVEVHFDEPVIEYPMVPIRWCIKPELLAYMREHATSTWAMVIVAQPVRRETRYDVDWNASKTVVMTVNGTERIGDSRGYINFRGPGDYDFVTYLLKTDVPASSLWSRLKKVRDSENSVNVWEDDGEELATSHKLLNFIRSGDTLVAMSHMKVTVPTGIFAKPLPEWVKAWLAYFPLWRLKDECSARGQLALAFTVGVLYYLAFELVKRSWILVLGVLHFLFGGNPFPVWGLAFTSNLSAWTDGFFAGGDYEEMMDYDRPWKLLLLPVVPAIILSVIATWVFVPASHMIVIYVITAIVMIAAIITGLNYYFKAHSARKEEEAMRKGNQALARVETYAVCGMDAPTKGPITVSLVWNGVKRAVCRNYA